MKLLQSEWTSNHDRLLKGLLDCLEETEELIGTAAQEDMDRWGINNYRHEEEYRKLRTWLTNRFNYLDRIIPKYPVH